MISHDFAKPQITTWTRNSTDMELCPLLIQVNNIVTSILGNPGVTFCRSGIFFGSEERSTKDHPWVPEDASRVDHDKKVL